jgi:LysM repeat protein
VRADALAERGYNANPNQQTNNQKHRKEEMKVSKVVLLVVALHVLVIGGIFVFEGCSRAKAPAPDMAENESSATDTNVANLPALPAESGVPQTLTPAQPAVAPVAAAPVVKTYVVKKGDTLSKIAKAQNTSTIELTKANNLTKTSLLKIGQKLHLPEKAPAVAVASAPPSSTDSTTPAVAAAPAPAEVAAYTVKSGDSLWKIARQQSTTVAALKQANNLTSDALKVGQKLQIPAMTAKAPATTTTVSAGVATPSYMDWHEPGTATENGQTVHYVDINESPAIIAKKYGVKVDDLMKVNGVSDARRIYVGQKLMIPTQPVNTPTSTTTATPAVAAPIVTSNN